MTILLSRYAEALFWFARYVERAASLARILHVQAAHWQDHSSRENWASILALYVDQDRFLERYELLNGRNVARFYITDRDNPGSILSCLWAARENARLLRPLISVSMWSYVNVCFNDLNRLGDRDLDASRLARTCEQIARRCDSILGVTEGTYYRDAGWRFYQLGLWIERADQTSRLLDVKVAQVALHNGMEAGAVAEFWKLLLHSFEAYHAFQRAHLGPLDPQKVAGFLMFDGGFPRSLTHCIGEIEDLHKDLYVNLELKRAGESYSKLNDLRLILNDALSDPDLHSNFHGFNDKVQNHLIAITGALAHAFFGHGEQPLPLEPIKTEPSEQSQSQQSGDVQS